MSLEVIETVAFQQFSGEGAQPPSPNSTSIGEGDTFPHAPPSLAPTAPRCSRLRRSLLGASFKAEGRLVFQTFIRPCGAYRSYRRLYRVLFIIRRTQRWYTFCQILNLLCLYFFAWDLLYRATVTPIGVKFCTMVDLHPKAVFSHFGAVLPGGPQKSKILGCKKRISRKR